MYLIIMHLTIGKWNNYYKGTRLMILLEPPSFDTMFSQVFHLFLCFFNKKLHTLFSFGKLCVLSYHEAWGNKALIVASIYIYISILFYFNFFTIYFFLGKFSLLFFQLEIYRNLIHTFRIFVTKKALIHQIFKRKKHRKYNHLIFMTSSST